MIDKKFEDKLKNLRELYIDKRPEVSQKLEDSKKFEAFMALSDEEKEEKLQNLGIEILYTVNFLKIKNFSPEKFVKKILYEKLNTKVAVCGFNYHFGRGGTADAEDLKNICKNFGIEVKIIKPVLYKETPVSSSRIRNAIKQNKTLEINQMLGKN